MRFDTNFDPNPESSEIVRQAIVVVNGVQKVVEKVHKKLTKRTKKA